MKKLSLKYYKLPQAAILILFAALIYLTINYFIGLYIIGKFSFFMQQLVVFIISFFSVGTILSIFNDYGFGLFYFLFGLPDLRGEYVGKLISSYHIDDDESKPHITKHVKLAINQNFNGFYIKSFFLNYEASVEYSSSSHSVSHDIDKIENGKYIITYRYKNNKNDFQDRKPLDYSLFHKTLFPFRSHLCPCLRQNSSMKFSRVVIV